MSYNESLRANSNYPPMSQSDWDRAPWNEVELPPKEVEVTISAIVSKTMKVPVRDYTIDEKGLYSLSSSFFFGVFFSSCFFFLGKI